MEKKTKKRYLDSLNKERERIYSNLGYLREGISKGEKGIPTHIADHGTDEFEKGLDIDISDAERKILQKISMAVEKIQNDKYGICDSCGKKIRVSRLKAIPYAQYCIKCQNENEKSAG